MTEVFTASEMRAYYILNAAGVITGLNSTIPSEQTDIHEAANMIIALAEQIKAERAVQTMKATS